VLVGRVAMSSGKGGAVTEVRAARDQSGRRHYNPPHCWQLSGIKVA